MQLIGQAAPAAERHHAVLGPPVLAHLDVAGGGRVQVARLLVSPAPVVARLDTQAIHQPAAACGVQAPGGGQAVAGLAAVRLAGAVPGGLEGVRQAAPARVRHHAVLGLPVAAHLGVAIGPRVQGLRVGRRAAPARARHHPELVRQQAAAKRVQRAWGGRGGRKWTKIKIRESW